MITVEQIARAIEGRIISRDQVLGRGPGHGPGDTSLSVWIAPSDPDGFTLYSHAGDEFGLCRDYLRAQLNLPTRLRSETSLAARSQGRSMRSRPVGPSFKGSPDPSENERRVRGLEIFGEAGPFWSSPAEAYLVAERSLAPFEGLDRALRFHPDCPFGTHRTPAMVALVRDLRTNEPRAIHRTALTLDGRKAVVGGHDRLTLGPVSGGAIKLTPDEDVTLCLGVGEGIESALSLRLLPEFGASSVWSLISANGIERLPVLAGIEALWLAVDRDPAGLGASRACAERWQAAGTEALLVTPHAERSDLNDVLRRRMHG